MAARDWSWVAIAKGLSRRTGSVMAESPVGASRGTRITLTFPRGPNNSKINVLVVDDEAAILRFLKPALEANNYELLSAGTVEEATRRIAADTPVIIVLDLDWTAMARMSSGRCENDQHADHCSSARDREQKN